MTTASLLVLILGISTFVLLILWGAEKQENERLREEISRKR